MSRSNAAETTAGGDRTVTADRVIVVDDEPTIRLLLSKFLTKKGFDVLTAEDAEMAWEQIQHDDIDVVLSDISLPGMSGTDLLDRLHEAKPGIPVILITGLASLEAAVECVKKGAFDYIAKPLVLSDLLQRVETALKSSRTTSVTDTTATRRDRVAGYMLEGLVGEGATSIVFRARREGLPDAPLRAMKFLKIGGLPGETKVAARERFLREADALSRVHHPHVVQFIEFGLVEDTREPFLVMEYIDGHPLDECLTRFSDLNLALKCDLLRQIASALDAIHRIGLCHRDIKPANIMIIPDRLEAKVTDFGVVKVDRSALTSHGGMVGSPAYMAPEALDNDDVTCQADLFSLGVMAYEFILGRRPFPSQDVDKLVVQIRTGLPPPPETLRVGIPDALTTVLAGLLRKNRAERYHSSADVAEDLAALARGLSNGQTLDGIRLRTPAASMPDWHR